MSATICTPCNAPSMTTTTPAGSCPGASFAFATIKDAVHLVQVCPDTPLTGMTAVDVKVFRHDCVSVFRFAGTLAVHPADLRILEVLADEGTLYEEHTGTVFLAKENIERLRKMSRAVQPRSARRLSIRSPYSGYPHGLH
ncbi:hypothetical protein K523DRAFT_322193 [Schizophyllum commune Tattone D]|uniref:Uncharacterized protein n=1 Tax=Schizophyllum commune (strain H4-8 / FGSC 9210) TaxID=578458 RepID=D8QDN7_SCHCM|nr:uncharacterized protein SCHCODRAFT_02637291 [Schizophyllum commune H4-8]KAI5827360.1 hypothetical protein K523DRAFT_322193 [Schizophyllum commune Tattone D]KAI5888644.1 hypothetical protein SCHCODRAFT_02637291 [Schizophyllum commune H4-8]